MSTRNLHSQAAVDSAAWNVFARHRPYYHILSDPSMLDAGPEAQKAFWATGDRDVQELMTFAGLSHVGGLGVDFGCGLGRLTRALIPYTASQTGIDISTDMVDQARELHAASPTLTFRAIEGVDWPIPSGTASLVISMLVFPHLSTADLVEHSLREIGRVLAEGGHAVFSIQTNTRRGVFVQWLRRIARVGRPRFDAKHEAIRQRLTSERATLDEVTTEEIVAEMLQMEFRRMKSFPLHRVASILRSSGLTMRKVLRDPADGSTLLAVDK